MSIFQKLWLSTLGKIFIDLSLQRYQTRAATGSTFPCIHYSSDLLKAFEVNYICGTACWCWLSRYLASRSLEKPYRRFSVSAQQEGSDRCFHSCEELPGGAGSFSSNSECLKWALPVYRYTVSSCYNTSARNAGFLVALQWVSRHSQPHLYSWVFVDQNKPSCANISPFNNLTSVHLFTFDLPECKNKFVIDKR